MFRQWYCGCVVSQLQGRVRVCATHRPAKATGDGGAWDGLKGAGVKCYPANGEMVANWTGR